MKSLLLAVMGLLCCMSVSAEDFEVGGIYYDITSSWYKTVAVTYREYYPSSYDEYSGEVKIPESVTYNGNTYSVTSIGNYAFSDCSSLTSVEIGNSVTSIGYSAFDGCSSLTSVEIPNSVTSIGDHAFRACSSLTSVEIPNSVTSIGEWAFYYCSSLTSVELPNSVTSIGSEAFYGTAWYNNQPDGVIYVGKVLYQYKGTMPANTSITIEDGTVSISPQAFWSRSSLTSVEIPNSVTNIGWGAFYHCSSLTSVEIPNSVTSIGSSAFDGTAWYNNQPDGVIYAGKVLCDYKGTMPANTSITIEDGTVSISPYAFEYCSSLTSVELPNSVTSIGDYAFRSCESLTSVEIGNSVETIDTYAFSGCNLKKLISYAEVPPVCGSYVFYQVNTQECTLYVPYGAKSAYASTDGWNDFANIVEMEQSYYDLTVSAAGYATLYLDYATEIPGGVEVYTAKEVDGIWLKMAQVEDVLPANTAVIVKAPAGTYTFVQTATETSTIADNLLNGSATDAYIDVPSNSKAFVLSMVDGQVGMYLAKLTDGRFLNNANKAYLLLDNNKLGLSDEELDTSVGGAQLSLRFDFGSATGIDAVQTETEKVIYDLYGRKVNQITGSGIYIIGGKKVYVR